MTKDELIKVLLDDCDDDPEAAHCNADNALLAYINDPEITVAFNSVEKWYA